MVRFPQDVLTHIIAFIKPNPQSENCLDTIEVLMELCRLKGLASWGKKIDLIHRLLNAGLYARRPFWDTPANANFWGLTHACPRPMLTFREELHNAHSWLRTTDDVYANIHALRAESNSDKVLANRFLLEYWESISTAEKYHDQYVHEMNKIEENKTCCCQAAYKVYRLRYSRAFSLLNELRMWLAELS